MTTPLEVLLLGHNPKRVRLTVEIDEVDLVKLCRAVPDEWLDDPPEGVPALAVALKRAYEKTP